MRLHPIVSIILGFIVFVILDLIAALLYSFSHVVYNILFIVSIVFAGFIATYSTKTVRIRYSFYEGVLLILLFILASIAQVTANFTATIFLMIIFSIIGGFIAKMTDKDSRQSFKTTYLDKGLNPIVAIILGIIIAWMINVLLQLIFYHNNSSVVYYGTGAISFLAGGFVTTLLSKEKKIRYGLYYGIILAIISYVDIKVQELLHIQVNHVIYYIFIATIMGYLLCAVIGGYFGIIAAKRLNKTRNVV